MTLSKSKKRANRRKIQRERVKARRAQSQTPTWDRLVEYASMLGLKSEAQIKERLARAHFRLIDNPREYIKTVIDEMVIDKGRVSVAAFNAHLSEAKK